MSTNLKNINGENIFPTTDHKTVYVGCVLDANNSDAKFIAMKQLFDIADKGAKAFDAANCGIVARLPIYNTEMFAGYDFDFIFKKNENTQTHPASTTKVMSLITGLDWITDLHEIVTIKSSDISSGSGSTYYDGDRLTLESVMFAMMLESSNTCTNTFARYCGKKMLNSETATDAECRAEFIRQMNLKAVEIGMTNSVFDTPHGMTKTNLTTAHDMILATIEACRFPWILRAWRFIPERTIHVFGEHERDVVCQRSMPHETLSNAYHVFGGKTGTLYYDEFSAHALVMVACAK